MTPRLLRHVAFPLLVFRSREPGGFPERWPEGEHRVFMFLFGIVPFGSQTIAVSHGVAEDGTVWVRDNGHGFLVRVWDHRIEIKPGPDGTTRYCDTADIKAGLLTVFVWAFAHIFYRWRQARWRALARGGFEGLS